MSPRLHPTLRRGLLSGGTALIALLSAPWAPAHDWPSPPPGARRALPPNVPFEDQGDGREGGQHGGQGQPEWAGLLWRGPAHGAPAAPQAKDCHRPPRTFEIDGPAGFRQPRMMGAGRAAPTTLGAATLAVAPSPPSAAMPAAPMAAGAAERRTRDAAAASREAAATAREDAAPSGRLLRQAAPAGRPADEPVSVGMVDDNADFGEYQAYRQRARHFPRRELAVHDRVRLDVRDAAGRAVPDARVQVFADGQPQALWARTDAAGRAWLMPQADMPARNLAVEVSQGGRSTRVAWHRGQRDALQAQLEGAAAPRPARLDLVFLVDATGSMADEIDKLKRSMRQVADQIARLPSQPDLCFALVAYRDRGDEFFVRGADFSDDLSAFQAALAPLQAGGGGDTPEALNEALHTAVHRLSWRGDGTARLVVLVADAPPHLDYGQPYYDHDLRAAQARGIKLFSVGASGLDPQGEYIFRQMAQFTGGRFVFLTYDRADDPGSGPGRATTHDVRDYSVHTLDKLLVRLVSDELAAWPRP